MNRYEIELQIRNKLNVLIDSVVTDLGWIYEQAERNAVDASRKRETETIHVVETSPDRGTVGTRETETKDSAETG